MIVKRHLNLFKTLYCARFEVNLGIATSLGVYLLYDIAGVHRIGLPVPTASILGLALAIFLGFRNNAAYARWNEATVMWSTISSNSRTMGRLVVTLTQAHNHTPSYNTEAASAWQVAMAYRQIAWVHVLRLELRGQDGDEKQMLVV
jgi:ion channel-forming bestrophin family protein